MKALAILAIAAAAVTLTSTASADKYGDLVAQGFRWANVNGLYACVSKDDVPRVLSHPSDEVVLKLVEQVKAYFLTPGTIVQVTEEDTHSGLSKIHMAGIAFDLWTPTRFLSKHPIKDTYGVVETPETSGLITTVETPIDVGPTPGPVPGIGLKSSPIPTPTPGTNQ